MEALTLVALGLAATVAVCISGSSSGRQSTKQSRTHDHQKEDFGYDQPKANSSIPIDYDSYRCTGHPNRALAYREGIANSKADNTPLNFINIRKIRNLGESQWKVELVDFNNHEAIAVIPNGKNFIATFYVRPGTAHRQLTRGFTTLEAELPNKGRDYKLQEWVKFGLKNRLANGQDF